MTTLAERHRSAQAHASGAPVEVLSGAAAIRRRLLLMQDQATIEVCTMMPVHEVHSVITVEDNHDAIEDVLMRRGIALRSVIERDWLERPEMAATATAYAAQGQRISVVDELPIKLIIVDRRMALLPLAPSATTSIRSRWPYTVPDCSPRSVRSSKRISRGAGACCPL